MRQVAMRALYEGSLADVGDANPYAGRSRVLANLWQRGYARNLKIRITSGPAMQTYLLATCCRCAADDGTAGPWLKFGSKF
ncbi:ribosome modulation factor [Mycobacterium timonense]|jgi:hypothetical protein|uniref:Uncharacterized protein n=2 Tax=Mycobacterium timonense TaxID=701043 RepID=A0A7I9ZB96_9MYCO|nr:hypothetical protein MTIM_40170 [Mycobacterium timonense]